MAHLICAVDRCGKHLRSDNKSGYCRDHHKDRRKCVDCGKPSAGERCRACKGNRACTVVEANGATCSEPHYGNGTCWKHWVRVDRHGDPNIRLRRANGEADEIVRQGAHAATNECILLDGRDGRPHAWFDGRLMTASRAAWCYAHGDPGEAHVLHTCHRGDEGCVNIRHLYLGDDARNRLDMVEAGRSNREFEVWNCRLSDEDVQTIRALAEDGVPRKDIATRFDTSESYINQIVRRDKRPWVE